MGVGAREYMALDHILILAVGREKNTFLFFKKNHNAVLKKELSSQRDYGGFLLLRGRVPEYIALD